MRTDRLAWLFGLAAVWLVGCDKPCETTAQCGEDGMCVAALCQPLVCEKTIFALDPASGECVPLSGCFLTDAQRDWHTCNDDPCLSQSEDSCIRDARCQPVYANPNVSASKSLGSEDRPNTANVACAGVSPVDEPKRTGDGIISAPGVNNGDTPKHPQPSSCSVVDGSARVYSGCRTPPRIAAQKPCEQLTASDCATRRDCSESPPSSFGPGRLVPPSPDGKPITESDPSGVPPLEQGTFGQCFTRFTPPASDCGSASAAGCLLSPTCQPIGSRCYCPPGGQCDCEGGSFLGCEPNDRLRRCSNSSDCSADERCDNDEACIAPRTFASAQSSQSPVPGSPSCIGACVPKGCAGLGEVMCNAHAECDGGSYGTICRPKPYCAGGRINEGPSPTDDPARPGTNNCGCDSAFTGCGAQTPVADLRPERSLLVRDPEIIDDPAFAIDSVLGKLAPAGQVDAFTASLLNQIGAAKTLANGASSGQRSGFSSFVKELSPELPGVAQRLAGLVHTTALINRLDLAKPGSCGEARLTYALTRAYTDGNQRLTLIVELKVPDDGNGCRTVAQRWAELSSLDSLSERRTRLSAIYKDLLVPAGLGQLRTNEFLNRSGGEAWELREFRLGTSGLPELAPVAQTVDSRKLSSPDLRTWLTANAAALHAGSAEIPTQYLAAVSREDGGRLRFSSTDPAHKTVEQDLNAQSCAGCHLTETKSPFVHIGERLGQRISGTSSYRPVGRAIIDSFLQKELLSRAKNLRAVLSGTAQPLLFTPQTGLARVH